MSETDALPVSNKKQNRLTLWILVAVVAAIVLALVRPRLATSFEVGGEIFFRLLTMMVVPLVMASVMSGIIRLGDVRRLGRPGAFTIAYYLTTTVMAVIVGLILVNLIQPGVGTIDQETLEALAAEGGGCRCGAGGRDDRCHLQESVSDAVHGQHDLIGGRDEPPAADLLLGDLR